MSEEENYGHCAYCGKILKKNFAFHTCGDGCGSFDTSECFVKYHTENKLKENHLHVFIGDPEWKINLRSEKE